MREKFSYGFGDFASCLYWQTVVGLPRDLLHRHLRDIGARGRGDDRPLAQHRRLLRPGDRHDRGPHPVALGKVPAVPPLRLPAPGRDRRPDLHGAEPRGAREAHLGVRHVQRPHDPLHGDQHPVHGAARASSRRTRTSARCSRRSSSWAPSRPASSSRRPSCRWRRSGAGSAPRRSSTAGRCRSWSTASLPSSPSCSSSSTRASASLPPKSQKTSVLRDLGDLVTNGPWLILLATTITFILFVALRGNITAHYFKYYVGSQTLTLPSFLPKSAAGHAGLGMGEPGLHLQHEQPDPLARGGHAGAVLRARGRPQGRVRHPLHHRDRLHGRVLRPEARPDRS